MNHHQGPIIIVEHSHNATVLLLFSKQGIDMLSTKYLEDCLFVLSRALLCLEMQLHVCELKRYNIAQQAYGKHCCIVQSGIANPPLCKDIQGLIFADVSKCSLKLKVEVKIGICGKHHIIFLCIYRVLLYPVIVHHTHLQYYYTHKNFNRPQHYDNYTHTQIHLHQL